MASDELIDEYYKNHYQNVHGQGRLGVANRQMHHALEKGRRRGSFPVTLELGAGNFEHFPFVTHGFEDYVATDIRRPGLQSPTPTATLPEQREVSFVVADANALPFEDGFADRVVAACLLMHLADPRLAVVEAQRVCKPTGVIDFLVPCDPGILMRVFRRVVSEPSAKKSGVLPATYRLVNAVEHLSPFNRVLTLTKSSIEPGRALRVRYFPFSWIHSWNLNAFAIFSIEPKE